MIHPQLASATAHGKIILMGEHAVVYGYPALVSSIKLKTTVTVAQNTYSNLTNNDFLKNILRIFSETFQKNTDDLNFQIISQIPIGSGLGSSAATASAAFQSLAIHFGIGLTKNQLLELTMDSERFAHGNPSGIDPTAVVYEGILQFQKTPDGLDFSSIPASAFDKYEFFLIQSGIPLETTKTMVEQVARLLKSSPQTIQILQKIGRITKSQIKNLKSGKFDPQLITQNQRLLEQINVVSPKSKDIIKLVEECGGVAKILGGGGIKAGSGMILAYHPVSQTLKTLAEKYDWENYQIRLGFL